MPIAGSRWVYEFMDRQYGRQPIEVTVRAVHVDALAVNEAVTSSGPSPSETRRTVGVDEGRFFMHRMAGDIELAEFAPYLLSAKGEKTSAVAIAAAGYPVGSGNPAWVVQSGPAVWEQIMVPAGTFMALRLEACGKRISQPSDPRITRRFHVLVWYAPEVNRYIRLEQKEWLHSSQNSHVVVELKKFSPPS